MSLPTTKNNGFQILKRKSNQVLHKLLSPLRTEEETRRRSSVPCEQTKKYKARLTALTSWPRKPKKRLIRPPVEPKEGKIQQIRRWIRLDKTLNKFNELSLEIHRHFKSDTVNLESFNLLKVIGKGTFGKVVLARHKQTLNVCAIKMISKALLLRNPSEIKHVVSERNALISTQHPFLVGLQYAFQSPSHLFLALDYIGGGELFYHLQKERKFPEDRVRFYSAEITSALSFLHSKNIVYRDLKPENILLDKEGHVVLTDFGLAKVLEKETQTFCGTPEYLAPEVLKMEPYGLAVDWWCLGCVIYEMLVGLPPFYSSNQKELFDKILFGQLRFPVFISSCARSLISSFLVRSPKDRLSNATEIMNHEFFKSLSWSLLLKKEYKPPFVPDLKDTIDLRYIDPTFKKEDPKLKKNFFKKKLNQDVFREFLSFSK